MRMAKAMAEAAGGPSGSLAGVNRKYTRWAFMARCFSKRCLNFPG